ncbi:MAG: FAD-dependent oxidoreductase, partial [Planctomycetota bacterium]
MNDRDKKDIAIIGGGIVGLATAMALVEKAEYSVLILEAEDRLAAHQTGNNSGVIHSGLYYKPGSLKARNCVEGREALYRFCREEDIPYELCGKVVLATCEEQRPSLKMLEDRGRANGLQGLKHLASLAEIKAYEPHAQGIAGLWVPETGIVDYVKVAEAYARRVRENGGEILMKARVCGFRAERGG